MVKPYTPIHIHPQRCYDCGKHLADGESAIAHTDQPLAFCVGCRGRQEGNHPQLCKAVVRGDRS